MESVFRKVPSLLQSLRSHSLPSFGVVIGNEAGDLDSVVCTCVLAAWMDRNGSVPFLPLLNFKREDLTLRTEVTFCFKKLGFDLSNVAFVDDLPWEEVCSEERLSEVALVDHNVINTPALKFMDASVKTLFDHHVVERDSKALDHLSVNVIETVGSCTSLVAEYILKKQPEFEDTASLNLLRWTILMDTVNLSIEHKKVTPKDLAILEKLENMLSIKEEDAAKDRQKIYTEMSYAKGDTSGFTSYQLLRKDLKAVYFPDFSLAMSTVPGVTCSELAATAGFTADLEKFLQSEDFKMSVILASNGGVLIYPKDERAEKLRDRLVELDVAKVGPLPAVENAFYMERTSPAYTRKKIMPIVKETLATK